MTSEGSSSRISFKTSEERNKHFGHEPGLFQSGKVLCDCKHQSTVTELSILLGVRKKIIKCSSLSTCYKYKLYLNKLYVLPQANFFY
jgi:hypothetical protein